MHLIPWVACNMQGMFGIEAALHWPPAGVRHSWTWSARPNRGSWCTGNVWDCRLFLVNLALQNQLSPAPWVAYLWLQRADVHVHTHTHKHPHHLHRECQDQRESYHPSPFTITALHLVEGSRERCYSPMKPQQSATSSHITLKCFS